MSEKVKFRTTEFNLIPMGITEDTTKKTRLFKFISELSYSEVIAIVTNPNNYDTVTIIGQDGNPQTTYADCVSFKGMAYENEVLIGLDTIDDVYTVTYSVDAIARAVSTLQAKLDSSQVLSDNAVAELTILIATLYGMVA